MRIVVTGKHGQVARALTEIGPEQGHEIVLLGRPELDLERPETVAVAVSAARPDVVVSAAAYTAVDAAEGDVERSFKVNAAGAGAVAAAAASLGVPVVHLSTDYVFGGDLDRPYREADPTAPQSVYGHSKLAGEAEVATATPNHAILRTAWVYAPFGKNFAATMLRLAVSREVVRVVADQRGAPTSAHDIAGGVLRVAENLARSEAADLRGVFHMTSAGEATWADFAEAVFEESAKNGGPSACVERITTADYPTPAKRPANSRLDCSKIQGAHGVALPHWRESVTRVVGRLIADAEAVA